MAVTTSDGYRNLLQWSEDGSKGVWTPVRGTKTAGQTDSAGGSTATLFTDDTQNGSHRIQQIINITNQLSRSLASSDVFEATLTVKAGTLNSLQLYLGDDNSHIAHAVFRLDTVAVHSSFLATASITANAAGGGWYDLKITCSNAVGWSGSNLYLFLIVGNNANMSYTGSGAGTLTICFPMVRVAGPTAYERTYDVAGTRNLLRHSGYPVASPWNVLNATFAAGGPTGPNGTNAFTYRETAGTGIRSLWQPISTPLVNGRSYTWSVYAKSPNRTCVLAIDGVGSGSFDLTAGTASGSVVTPTITSLGDGWHRCSITGTWVTGASTSPNIRMQTNASYTGDGTGVIYFQDPQFEADVYEKTTQRITYKITPQSTTGLYNKLTWSEDPTRSPWTRRNTISVASSGTGPNGRPSVLVSNMTGGGANDFFQVLTGSTFGWTAGNSLQVGAWIKRVSTSGVLRIVNAQNGAGGSGRFDVDLSLLGDAWEWIHSTHPAVTGYTPWVVAPNGSAGIHLFMLSGSSLSFYFGGAHQGRDGGATYEYTEGGDYSTLATWESGTRTTPGEKVAECYTGNCATVNFGQSATEVGRAVIRPASGHRHNGVSFTSGAYILNTGGGYALYAAGPNFSLDAVSIYDMPLSASVTNGMNLGLKTNKRYVVSGCLVSGNVGNGTLFVSPHDKDQVGWTATIENNLVINTKTDSGNCHALQLWYFDAGNLPSAGGTVFIRNNTGYAMRNSASFGIACSGTTAPLINVYFHNNVGLSASAAGIATGNFTYVAGSNNLSSGGSGVPGSSNQLNKSADSTLIAPGSDYRLRPGSAAIDNGSAAYAPATDIRGLPRFGNAPDIGAYEFVMRTSNGRKRVLP